ncbi:MAG: cytochrome c [Deltaproteobacteria bacterium]|nr:cytochrome c [Deltaproteobacteria bacterium]
MLPRPIVLALVVALGATVAGCAPMAPLPNGDDVRWATARDPKASLASLERGRDLYVMKCAGCHHLPPPDTHPPERWPTLVSRMIKDTALPEADVRLIALYLSSASARLRGGRSAAPASAQQ